MLLVLALPSHQFHLSVFNLNSTAKHLADGLDLLHDNFSVEGTKCQCIPFGDTQYSSQLSWRRAVPDWDPLGLPLGGWTDRLSGLQPPIDSCLLVTSTHRPASYLVLGLPRGELSRSAVFQI